MRATATVEIEKGIRANYMRMDGMKRFGSAFVGSTIDEKIVNFMEKRAWCHNVANIKNFRKNSEGNVLVDVEYNIN